MPKFTDAEMVAAMNELKAHGVPRDVAFLTDAIADLFDEQHERRKITTDHATAFALTVTTLAMAFGRALGAYLWIVEVDADAVQPILAIAQKVAHDEFVELVANEDEQFREDRSAH